MIIRIDDMPKGQKIKHINVDVTFEDDGTPIIKTEEVPNVPYESALGKYPPLKALEPKDYPNESEGSVLDARPKKEIPPEMNDMVF